MNTPTTMKHYHIASKGQQLGAFPESAVRSMLAVGKITPNDLCWTAGMEEWQPIRNVFQLSSAEPPNLTAEQPSSSAQTSSALAQTNPEHPSMGTESGSQAGEKTDSATNETNSPAARPILPSSVTATSAVPFTAEPTFEYVGFWVRVVASIIDSIIIMAITTPFIAMIYGGEFLIGADAPLFRGQMDIVISYLLPAVATVLFWLYKRATPGKMIFSAHVVDAKTGQTITTSQAIVRYLGYFLSMLIFMLGFIWVAFDSRKRGWHDMLAGTVVVKAKPATLAR